MSTKQVKVKKVRNLWPGYHGMPGVVVDDVLTLKNGEVHPLTPAASRRMGRSGSAAHELLFMHADLREVK